MASSVVVAVASRSRGSGNHVQSGRGKQRNRGGETLHSSKLDQSADRPRVAEVDCRYLWGEVGQGGIDHQ